MRRSMLSHDHYYSRFYHHRTTIHSTNSVPGPPFPVGHHFGARPPEPGSDGVASPQGPSHVPRGSQAHQHPDRPHVLPISHPPRTSGTIWTQPVVFG